MGPPVAATVAFVATLGALLMGYWAGYAVGTGAMGDTAVAAAAEKTSRRVAPEEAAPAAPSAPEAAAAPEAIEPPANGMHLQVSALSDEKAASALRQELESRGFPVRVEAPAEDELVRVYVGPIADSDDLTEWANKLRAEGLDPFPKRL